MAAAVMSDCATYKVVVRARRRTPMIAQRAMQGSHVFPNRIHHAFSAKMRTVNTARTRALSRILYIAPQQQVENGQTIANTYPGGCAGAGGHALSREDPTTAIVSKETAFVTVSTAMAGVAFHQAVENGWESQVSTRLYRMI
jgi:hypothetical protein